MGLVEPDWVGSLSAVDPDDLDYKDFLLTGKKIARKMKRQEVSFFYFYSLKKYIKKI
jgi:hypothetical protein